MLELAVSNNELLTIVDRHYIGLPVVKYFTRILQQVQPYNITLSTSVFIAIRWLIAVFTAYHVRNIIIIYYLLCGSLTKMVGTGAQFTQSAQINYHVSYRG